jgi:hypothetical protein
MATLINGESVSWAQVQIQLLGAPLTGIRSVKWNAKREKTNNYGAGSKPVSRGYGRYEYEGSITFLAEEWKNIIAASPNSDPLELNYFDVNVLFVSATTGLVMQCTWKAAEILENPFDVSEGDTMVEIEVPFVIADIQITTA